MERFLIDRTKVTNNNIIELKFRKKVNYLINKDFVDFPEHANPTPKIYLLDVEIECASGFIKKPVVYFFMEYINFLDEVLLKNKINLSHFVKVREGFGFGGNKKSISIAYAFLGQLKVKHILVDSEEHTDMELINKISIKHDLKPGKYNLKNPSQKRNILDWSGLSVKVLDVVLSPDETLTGEELKGIIGIIRSE